MSNGPAREQIRSPFILGIAGGSGSGKTTLGRCLTQRLGIDACSIVLQDYYYRDQSRKFDGDGMSVNFDHPDAIEFSLLVEHLHALADGAAIEAPQYDFTTHKRLAKTFKIEPRPLVIVDGILILSQPALREALSGSIFVFAPEEVRFERRLQRDVKERGRTPDGVKAQFINHVKPMHDVFVDPSQEHAELVLSGTQDLVKETEEALRYLRSRGVSII